MAAARELLTAYISLELLSFSLYVLVSYAKFDTRSNEAGLKYMLLGAFASAMLLYGISLIYGITGSTTYYARSAPAFADGTGGLHARHADRPDADRRRPRLQGRGRAVPHVDAGRLRGRAAADHRLPLGDLEGGGLRAAAAAVQRAPSCPSSTTGSFMIAALAAMTMIVGNLVALQQHNIKRLMAYSSIGQVGYMLMGIAALSPARDAARCCCT